MSSQSDTIATLEWAREAAQHDETVRLFWDKLADAVNEPRDARAERILGEVRSYGSNSITSFFRGGGVEYAEVAYDTAETLAGTFTSSNCSEGDVDGCERFVLEKMAVKSKDLDVMAAGFVGRVVAATVVRSVVVTAAEAAAAQATKAAGQQVVKSAATEVAKATGKKAAEAAAKKAAQEAAKQASLQVAKRVIGAVNILFAAWTLIDLAGPAKRVTIPAVTYIALLRQLRIRTLHFAAV